MHICKLLKTDCVETQYDKAKLISMIDTSEAAALPDCESCVSKIGSIAD